MRSRRSTAMHATGLFFLRTAPYHRALRDGTYESLWLPVVERAPGNARVILNELIAVWRGAPGFQFAENHKTELRPGRGLLLTLDRLRIDPVHGPIGEITHCDIAPPAPSWIAGDAASSHASNV